MRKSQVALELAPEEEVVAIIRRGIISQLPRIAFIAAWILIPFFFFFPLLSFGPIGLLVFAGLASSGILYAIREWHMWYHTMWVVTDKRVIDVDQLGWTAHEVHDVALKHIKRVRVQRETLGAKLFRHATVAIETKSSQEYDVELEGVRRVKKLVQLLKELRSMKKRS